MKKNLTELVFTLDRSGSMGGLEQDTIGGFNAMLTRQKEQEGEANVTTILFDHEVQLLHFAMQFLWAATATPLPVSPAALPKLFTGCRRNCGTRL